jgi:hypothetical protein
VAVASLFAATQTSKFYTPTTEQQMHTVKHLHDAMQTFDAAARRDATPDAIRATWKRLFDHDMPLSAAKSFADYYKRMRSRKMHSARKHRAHGSRGSRKIAASRKHKTRRAAYRRAPVYRGGSAMVPGAYVQTYGEFPTDISTSGGAIRDLDRFMVDSLTVSPAGYWPTPLNSTGSNLVGGRRKTIRNRRRMRGGDFGATADVRMFNPTNPPSYAQQMAHSWSGAVPDYASADPVRPSWSYSIPNALQAINPSIVTPINTSLNQLANNMPWQTSV